MGEGRLLDRRDAVALARFLDEPREAFGTQVTIAERDKRRPADRRAATRTCGTARCQPASAGARADRRAVGGDLRAVHRADGLRRRDRQGAVPVGRDPPRPLRRRLRPRPPRRHAGGRGRQQGQRAQRPAARPDKRAGSSSSASGCAASRRAPARRAAAGSSTASSPPTAAAAGSSATAASTPSARADRRSSGSSARARPPAATRASSSAGSATRASAGAPDTPRAGPTMVVGYSVRLPGADEGPRRSVWYGGGRLARDLTLPALRRSWGQDERRATTRGRRMEVSTSASRTLASGAPGRA